MSRDVTAIAIAGTVIASEHFFTFALSSLPTTKRFFANSEEGRRDVRRSYMIASGLSLGFGLSLSFILRRIEPFITALVMSIIFIVLYERALKGEI